MCNLNKILFIFLILASITVESQTPPPDTHENDGLRDTNIKELRKSRYITGGIVGTVAMPFGVGHMIQGRWSGYGKGAIFTFGEMAIFALRSVMCKTAEEGERITFHLADLFRPADLLAGVPSRFSSRNCNQSVSLDLSMAVLGILRLWEIVDLWVLGDNEKVASLDKGRDKNIQFGIIPLLDKKDSGLALGMNMSF